MRVLMLAATVVLATLAPGRAIDHGLWTKVLAGAVRQGRVDYPKLAHNPDFDRYLQELATADPGSMANEQERLATYLNAYNAFVIKGIVDNWPLTQVTNVAGFFDKKTYPFAGRELTLDQIENTLARAVGDPRVHAALVCGAVGCPDLRAEAYSGASLDQQLNEQVQLWVNNPRWVKLDREGGKLLVSRVFEWYRPDFERAGGAAGFVKQYIKDEASKTWLAGGTYQVEYLKFDWSLNAAK